MVPTKAITSFAMLIPSDNIFLGTNAMNYFASNNVFWGVGATPKNPIPCPKSQNVFFNAEHGVKLKKCYCHFNFVFEIKR